MTSPTQSSRVLEPDPFRPGRLKSWQVYLFAIVVTAITLWFRIAVDGRLGGRPTLVIFTLPIMLSAYVGGLRGGLLATGLSFFGVSYYLLPPIHSFAIASAVERWQQFFLVLSGVVISMVNEALHRAHRRADIVTAEQRQAEAAVRASEARYRTLFEYAPDGIVIADSKSYYTDANASVCRMLGYTRDELIGLHASDIVAQSDIEHIEPALSVLNAKFDYQREWQLRRKDGSLFAAEVIATLMPDGHLLGMIRDITARKEMEKAQIQLVSIVNSSDDAIISKTLDGIITSWNPGAEKIFGYAAAEVIGAPLLLLFPADRVTEEKEILAQIRLGDSVRHFETVRVRKDGTHIDVSVTLSPISDRAGNIIGASKIARDISKRKQAERAIRKSEEYFRFLNDLVEATRTLADPAQIMAVMARMLGQHLGASRCAYADVEPDSEQFTILHDYTDGCASTVGSYQLSLFGARAVTTLLRGQTLIIRNVEAELLPGEGADMFNAIGIQAIITCPLVKEGGLRAMMAVHQTTPRDWKPHEVSIVQEVVERCWATIERRTAEEKVRLLNAELEQRVIERTAQLEAANLELQAYSSAVSHDLRVAEAADQTKSVFLATMSHELRTPLNSIIGFTGIVLQGMAGPLNPEQTKQLGMVKGSAQHLLELINDILDLSKIEAGQFEVHAEPFDLRSALERVTAGVKPLADKKGLLLTSIVSSDLGVMVSDRRRVEQILINLLGNAIKFTESGSVTLTADRVADFQSSSDAAPEPALRLRVADTGIGMKSEDVLTLFQPFRQIDGSLARLSEGTGLGLAISRRLAALLGGEIAAASEWSKGSLFTVMLPMREPDKP